MAKNSKPDFSAAAAGSKDIFAAIANGGPQGPQEAPSVQSAHDAQCAQSTKQVVRFNYKMPVEYKAYLQRAIYRESEPGHFWTITEYLNHLIAMDMARNGEEPQKNED